MHGDSENIVSRARGEGDFLIKNSWFSARWQWFCCVCSSEAKARLFALYEMMKKIGDSTALSVLALIA